MVAGLHEQTHPAELQDHELEEDMGLRSPAEQARILALLVERVDIGTDGLNLRLRIDGLDGLAREMRADGVRLVA